MLKWGELSKGWWMEEEEPHGLVALLPPWAVQHVTTLPSCWNKVCELCQWRKDVCSPSNLAVSLRRNHTLMTFWDWHGKKCGWSSQSLGQCYFICVLLPVKWQRIAPVFKKKHISILPLKLRGKDALLEKDALAAQRKGAIIPFPKQKSSFATLHPLLQLSSACLLALCCFLSLMSDPFPLTRCPCVTASVRDWPAASCPVAHPGSYGSTDAAARTLMTVKKVHEPESLGSLIITLLNYAAPSVCCAKMNITHPRFALFTHASYIVQYRTHHLAVRSLNEPNQTVPLAARWLAPYPKAPVFTGSMLWKFEDPVPLLGRETKGILDCSSNDASSLTASQHFLLEQALGSHAMHISLS